MSDTMETEITLRIRLDQPVSDKALADEVALHIGALDAARQPFRNGASRPRKATADFAVAATANRSMSAAGPC